MAFARVNCVDPEELLTKHLFDEYREIPRVIRLAKEAAKRGENADDPRNPKQFTYGEGHIRFFYPRLQYLFKRQKAIIAECKKRGYNMPLKVPNGFLTQTPAEFYGDWKPDWNSILLNRKHLKERSNEYRWP